MFYVYLSKSNWINDFDFDTSDDEKRRVDEKLLNKRWFMLIDKFFFDKFFYVNIFRQIEWINQREFIYCLIWCFNYNREYFIIEILLYFK